MGNEVEGFMSFLAGFLIGAAIIGFTVAAATNAMWRNEAVQKEYAQYRTDTGEWAWKCDLEKVNQPLDKSAT